MLEESEESEGQPEMARVTERCEPDYESMVKVLNEKLITTEIFKNAALSYFEGKKARGKMAELIGELVTECNQLQKNKSSLIARQEASKTK